MPPNHQQYSSLDIDGMKNLVRSAQNIASSGATLFKVSNSTNMSNIMNTSKFKKLDSSI
jgi:hypothetical protein